MIPDELLADYSSTFLNVIKNDLEIEKLYDTSKKAFEKFKRTRFKKFLNFFIHYNFFRLI